MIRIVFLLPLILLIQQGAFAMNCEELLALVTGNGRLEFATNTLRRSGHLANNESFADGLLRTQQTIMVLGFTREALAQPLLAALQERENSIDINGRTYGIARQSFRGAETSPFDGSSVASTRITLTDVQTGDTLSYSALDAHIISCSGLCSGTLSPERISRFFALRAITLEHASASPVLPPQTGSGVAPVIPVSNSNFVVGGVNSTAAIRRLTQLNSRPITELEQSMRPDQMSENGFLGRDEILVEVLAGDNQFVVDQNGLTHQAIADTLDQAIHLGSRGRGAPVTIDGTQYRVSINAFRGSQESPFFDGAHTNIDVTITNLTNSQSITFSGLLPHLIRQYGFYEGAGTSYRLSPQSILQVFPSLRH